MPDRNPRGEVAAEGAPERLTLGAIHRMPSQSAARSLLAEGGDEVVVVERGVPRTVLFNCPDGCGDLVVINVDPTHHPVWRLSVSDARLTLMPSVWRASGCRSHFIVWRSRIVWCSLGEAWAGHDAPLAAILDGDWAADLDAELSEEWHRVRAELLRERLNGLTNEDAPEGC